MPRDPSIEIHERAMKSAWDNIFWELRLILFHRWPATPILVELEKV